MPIPVPTLAEAGNARHRFHSVDRRSRQRDQSILRRDHASTMPCETSRMQLVLRSSSKSQYVRKMFFLLRRWLDMLKWRAVAILTLNPSRPQIDFYKDMVGFGYDVFFIVDNNTFHCPTIPNVVFVQINDIACQAAGFSMLNPVISRRKINHVSSWEKSLLYFSIINNDYDSVWFIEDDVFVPSISTFYEIDLEFPSADLISKENKLNETGELKSWYWWKFVPEQILPLPWASSMVCAVRLSKKLLRDILNKLDKNKHDIYFIRRMNKYLFIEYLFNTVALHSGLEIIVCPQLSCIEWRKEWKKEEIDVKKIYHPVKDQALQISFRQELGLYD